MKYVVFYTPAADIATTAPVHFADHVAQYQPYVARGELLMLGTFADPIADGAMGIFTTQDAAERFVAADPFVVHGVVASYRILGWNEAVNPS